MAEQQNELVTISVTVPRRFVGSLYKHAADLCYKPVSQGKVSDHSTKTRMPRFTKQLKELRMLLQAATDKVTRRTLMEAIEALTAKAASEHSKDLHIDQWVADQAQATVLKEAITQEAKEVVLLDKADRATRNIRNRQTKDDIELEECPPDFQLKDIKKSEWTETDVKRENKRRIYNALNKNKSGFQATLPMLRRENAATPTHTTKHSGDGRKDKSIAINNKNDNIKRQVKVRHHFSIPEPKNCIQVRDVKPGYGDITLVKHCHPKYCYYNCDYDHDQVASYGTRFHVFLIEAHDEEGVYHTYDEDHQYDDLREYHLQAGSCKQC